MLTTLLAMVGVFLAPGPQNASERPTITVSAAVSLTDVLTAAAKEYPLVGGGTIRFNYAASNVLARQIVNGAPVDLFISADAAQMDVVAAAGLLKENSRVKVLTNRLAVVVPSDRPRTFADIRELAAPTYRRIAIGDPAGVPAGVYAKQYLEKEGLWAEIAARVVPSASVRAALAAVESGAADAAIVYRTDARLTTRATVAWLVPEDRGPKIVYPAAVVRTSTQPGEAQRFLDFLRSDPGVRVLERFGFGTAR
jgi:molybdate transport system substrate-binding protein